MSDTITINGPELAKMFQSATPTMGDIPTLVKPRPPASRMLGGRVMGSGTSRTPTAPGSSREFSGSSFRCRGRPGTG